MGMIVHHSIVVTGDKVDVVLAQAAAIELGLNPSVIINNRVEDYHSFFIAPDGSKDGWETSNLWDSRRNQFVRLLKETNLHWVEVRFGPDPTSSVVTRSS